jgi:hypothetical protein
VLKVEGIDFSVPYPTYPTYTRYTEFTYTSVTHPTHLHTQNSPTRAKLTYTRKTHLTHLHVRNTDCDHNTEDSQLNFNKTNTSKVLNFTN